MNRVGPYLILGAISLVSVHVKAVKNNKKPNVIYILCDDLGYGELGYNGQKKIKTPELDALVARGMKLTDHYCGSSVSAPSRCVLMTGRHTGNAHIRANSPGFPGGQVPLPEKAETLGKLMKRAGYATACIGKWGLGSFWDSGNPNKQGFDYFFGYTDQVQAHDYYPKYLWRNGEKIPYNQASATADYSHDLFTEEAFSFVKQHKDTPFFLYLAYTIPHTRYQVPDLAQYKDMDWPHNMKIHAAMTTRMDSDVGDLVRLLRSLGLEENTLILFSSDNGAHGQGGSFEFFETSGELRDKKRSMYDGGVRSPSFAYWPGSVPAGVESDHISAFWDILPTLSDLTGEPIVGETDGISMLPTLLGKETEQKQHKYLYWELYEGVPNCAIRYGKWKGIVKNARKGMQIELYDITADEGELTDVAQHHPQVVAEIAQMMKESHTINPYWDRRNKPLFNVRKACSDHGVEPKVKRKK